MAVLNPKTPRRRDLHPRSWLHRGAILVVLSIALDLPAQTPSREFQLKAIFLFNFTQFVEWPAEAFARPDAPLVIGVLGDDPFGSFLDETVRGEKAAGHPLVVRRYRRVSEIQDCHILFICGTEARRFEQILADMKRRPILTVGDWDDFAGRGGMIDIFTQANRIRLRINLGAIESARLTVSSKLLRLAEVVGEKKS